MKLQLKRIDVKIIKLVLIALMALTCFTYVNNVSAEETVKINFTDNDETVTHRVAVQWLADNAITTGWDNKDGSYVFKPYENLTRSQMAAFLYRYAVLKGYIKDKKESDAKYASLTVPFIDIAEYSKDKNDLYYGMLWMEEEGISTGWEVVGGKEFRPNDNLTRADMAAFLYRFGVKLNLVENKEYANAFKDVFIEKWTDTKGNELDHYKGMLWMADTKVSEGWLVDGGKEFRPYNNLARADMAAFLYRLNNLKTLINIIDGTTKKATIDAKTGIATSVDGKQYVEVSEDLETGKKLYEELPKGKTPIDKNHDGIADGFGDLVDGVVIVDSIKYDQDPNNDGIYEAKTIAEVVKTLPSVKDYEKVQVSSALNVNDEDLNKALNILVVPYKNRANEGERANGIFEAVYGVSYNVWIKENPELSDTYWSNLICKKMELIDGEIKVTFRDDSFLTADPYTYFVDYDLYYKVSDDGKTLTLTNDSSYQKYGIDFESVVTINVEEGTVANNLTNFATFDFTNLEYVDLTGLITTYITDLDYTFYKRDKLVEIKGLDTLDFSNLTSCIKTFDGCVKLESVSLPENLVTSKVSNIVGMFNDCSSLKEIRGLNTWDTSNVKNFSNLFGNCSSVTKLDLPTNMVTEKATTLAGMFKNCKLAISEIPDMSSWDMSNVINYSYMFSGCDQISSLEKLENLVNDKVTNIAGMFANCAGLTNIDSLKSWNVSSVTNLESLFLNCNQLTDIDSTINGWNVEKVVNFSNLFEGTGLTEVVDLSNWSCISGVYYDAMFGEQRAITEIKVGKLLTEKALSIAYMLYNSAQLKDVEFLANNDISNVLSMEGLLSINYTFDCAYNLNPISNWQINANCNTTNAFIKPTGGSVIGNIVIPFWYGDIEGAPHKAN